MIINTLDAYGQRANITEIMSQRMRKRSVRDHVDAFALALEYQSTSASFRAPSPDLMITAADVRAGYRYILDGTGQRIRIERKGSQSATYALPSINVTECPWCGCDVYSTVFRVLPHRCR